MGVAQGFGTDNRLSHGNARSVEAALATYAIGASVPCAVDRDDPCRAFVERGPAARLSSPSSRSCYLACGAQGALARRSTADGPRGTSGTCPYRVPLLPSDVGDLSAAPLEHVGDVPLPCTDLASRTVGAPPRGALIQQPRLDRAVERGQLAAQCRRVAVGLGVDVDDDVADARARLQVLRGDVDAMP